MALPLHGDTKFTKLFGGILYNLGRTLTYVVLGAAFGLLGQGIGALGFQRWLSIVTGMIMIMTVLFPSLFSFNFGSRTSGGFFILNYIKAGLRNLFSTKSFMSLFTIGILNGFLPCGPLYSAIIISASYGNVMKSMLFMLMFGLGTMPMLLGISVLGNFISLPLRRKLSNFIPVVIVFLGILFILRGLNLGIPFLSPTEKKIKMKMKKTQKEHSTKKFGLEDVKNEAELGKQLSCCGS
ncbi:MAG TPA: sulfite exporter TauE/SafE family protein [Bacteroidetes bacterium]|nr:sulfite exporter TauE/SafE family protein [Bacteroidota bacterium]